jgi:SSS family solute:Na+ symporter
MYLVSQFVLSPYFIETALSEAAINGIINIKELGIIKAKAYPHFLHIMGILFVLNVGFMLIMGKLYPNKNVYTPKITDEIDITPWRYAKVIGLAITILVLSTYLIF